MPSVARPFGTMRPFRTIHAVLAFFKLAELAPLVGSEDLVESRVGLGVGRGHLARQAANGAGSLINRRRIILLYGCFQIVMRGAHLIVERLA